MSDTPYMGYFIVYQGAMSDPPYGLPGVSKHLLIVAHTILRSPSHRASTGIETDIGVKRLKMDLRKYPVVPGTRYQVYI